MSTLERAGSQAGAQSKLALLEWYKAETFCTNILATS